jgi:hypothetical protein
MRQANASLTIVSDSDRIRHGLFSPAIYKWLTFPGLKIAPGAGGVLRVRSDTRDEALAISRGDAANGLLHYLHVEPKI